MVNASPLPMIEWMILLLFLWPDTNIAGVFLDRIDERNGSGSQRTIFDKIWSRYCYCLFGWFSLGVVSVSSSMPLFALYTCCGGGVDCWSVCCALALATTYNLQRFRSVRHTSSESHGCRLPVRCIARGATLQRATCKGTSKNRARNSTFEPVYADRVSYRS